MYVSTGKEYRSQQAVAGAVVSQAPYRGPGHSVETIQSIVNVSRRDPKYRAMAEDVCRGLYGKDYLSEAAAIYHAACRGIRYFRDPATVEMIKDGELITKTRNADCDDLSVLIATLLGQIGITDVQLVTVGFAPSQISHVFVRFKDPRGSGRWIVLDPVAGPTTATMLRRVKSFQVYGGV